VGSFKNLLKNYEARKAEFYIKAFLHRRKASWLKSWLSEGWMGQMEMKCIFDNGKIFLYVPRFLR
jgi:hypothetical protein